MTTQTSLLRLILPVQGEFSGTWGDQVNAGLTNLLDSAIAGTTTLSTDADVTLTANNYASDQARAMVLLCSGARTAVRSILAPNSSKVYVVINTTTFSVTLKGVTGPTTGVTIYPSSTAICAWNGSDFVVVATNGTVTELNTGQLAGFRNRIINGNMAISQRNGATATAVGSTAPSAYNVDRWQAFRAAGATGATSQGQQLTGLTGGPSLFTKIQRNSGDTSTAVIYLATSLETGNIRDLQGKAVTLSFWLATVGAATTNGVVAAIQQGTGSDGNFFTGLTGATLVVASTALSAASWTKFSITGTVASNATQLGAVFSWTPTGTAGASDYFGVTNVQLELGSVATPFEERSYGLELFLCQRYYEIAWAAWSGNVTALTTYQTSVPFAAEKRIAPTISSISQAGILNGSFNSRSGAASTTRMAIWGGQASVTISAAGYSDSFSASAEL